MLVLNNLQKRNDALKSKLLHEQLKYGNYTFKHSNNCSSRVLKAYETHKSIYKAASSVGVNVNIVMDWFVQGGCGNPHFRDFYDGINKINGFRPKGLDMDIPQAKKEFDISKIEGVWCYTTQIDGERLSIISGNLDGLKQKVKSKNLPID